MAAGQNRSLAELGLTAQGGRRADVTGLQSHSHKVLASLVDHHTSDDNKRDYDESAHSQNSSART